MIKDEYIVRKREKKDSGLRVLPSWVLLGPDGLVIASWGGSFEEGGG